MKYIIFLVMAGSNAVAALPDRLTLLNTGPISSQANIKLVYFWATWCTNCHEKLIKTLPELRKVHQDIEVTTVSLDSERDRVEHYLKKQQIEIPVLFDPIGKLSEELNISAVPYWIVYKKDSKTAEWKTVDSAVAFDVAKIEKALNNSRGARALHLRP